MIGSLGAFAQKKSTKKVEEKANLVKLSIGIHNKLRIGYERVLTDKFTAGAVVDYYYGIYPGIKLEPFARWYMGSEAPKGLYLQGRFLYGSFSHEFFTGTKTSFSAMGGGVDLGYQWLLGKEKNLLIDLSVGVQQMPVLNEEGSWDNVVFYSTGPGGIFNPHLSFGYVF